MSVNSPVVGLRDPAVARSATAPTASAAPAVRTFGRPRRLPGAHRDPRCTFWRTATHELVYALTAGHVRPWRRGTVRHR